MANRFWVGGTSTWDATVGTKWATTSGGAGGQAVPTAADDVFFSSLSTGVCTIPTATAVNCRSLNCTGFTGTLKFNAATSTLNVGDASGGAVTFVAGMTLLVSSLGTINFLATTASTTYSLTSGGQQPPNLNINVGSTTKIQFADNIHVAGLGGITLTSGILDMNGKTVIAPKTILSGSTARTLTMGAASINSSGSGGVIWNAITGTNLTVTANTATLTLSGASVTFASDAINYNGMSLVLTGSGTDSITGGGGVTLANLTRTGTASLSDALSLSGPITLTGTLTLNGNSTINRLFIFGSTAGTAVTLTAATVSVTNSDFMDITGAGGGSWNLAAISGNSGDCGGNSGITFTSAATQTATGTSGFTWSTHGWTTRVPLPQDDVVIGNAFSASQTITADMPRLGRSIDFTGSTSSPILNLIPAAAYIFGSLKLVSGVTPAGTGSITFGGRSTYSITSAGATFTSNLLIAAPSGTYTLTDNFVCTNSASFFGAFGTTILLTVGTLTTNSNVTFTNAASGLSVSNGTTLNMGSGTWSFGTTNATGFWTNTGGTVNAGTSTILLANASTNTRTFSGANQTYNTLSYIVAGSTGQLTITDSNTFKTINFSDASNARTLAFASGITTTILNSFNVQGTAGKLMTINATTPASPATLSKSGGVVSDNYLTVQDSTATGGASWFAGPNSTNGGGNTGWIFNNSPSGFLEFF